MPLHFLLYTLKPPKQLQKLEKNSTIDSSRFLFLILYLIVVKGFTCSLIILSLYSKKKKKQQPSPFSFSSSSVEKIETTNNVCGLDEVGGVIREEIGVC